MSKKRELIQRHFLKCLVPTLGVVFCGLGISTSAWAQAWTNTSLSPAQRATALVSAMSESDIIAMLCGNPNGYIGSVPANSRLGIPSLNFEDGPDGVGDSQGGVTAFPNSVCLSATWDTNMARQYGIDMGQEEWGKGGQGFLGPTMNMSRLYNDGRNTENYGEDPYLSSAMAVNHIQGIQSQGIMVTAKHFVCNDQETDRFFVSADVDERTRQEIYYQPFFACVRGGASGIMSSYNRINDTYAGENPILNAVVKKLWGFDGFIMSDYCAYYSTVGAANDGLDLDMLNGSLSSTPLSAEIANGNVPLSEAAEMAYRILYTMFRFGNFDNPSPGNFNATVTNAAHNQFARSCAAAGTVLLQNSNNLLPLNTNNIHSIAVIGAAASTAPISVGYGSSEVTLPYNVTPLAGIQSRATNISVSYSVGDNDIPDAVRAAQSADVAVICVGQQTGESLDRTSLSLPGDEDALISAVSAVNPNTIVVLYCSSATLMPWSSSIAASLVAWFPGQENGNALAEVLFGDVNPSGKLPCSFPASASQEPLQTTAQFPGIGGHISYSEGLDIGYRWYDSTGIAPLFPFGHGLSYTTFGYTNLSVSSVSPSGQVQISFTLKNTGTVAGAEVPQLYLGFPSAAGEPPKILKGFQKITLQPGQSQQVTFNLDWLDIANWDQNARGWLVTPGTFEVMVGASSRDIRLTGSFSASSVPSSDLANAALHRVVTASSTLSTNNPASAAVDGDPTSFWNSSSTGSQWLMVDLGMTKDLSRVVLNWSTNYASSYSVQISPDATNWTTLSSISGGTGGINDLLVSGQGRYLRVLATFQGGSGTGYGLNELQAYAQQQKPFNGTVATLPAQIPAANFDNGGENVGYYNTSSGNQGGAYRTNEDIGIASTTDSGNGYYVGWINPGEWLEYTVNPPDPEAIYSISVRAASITNSQVRVILDGQVLGTLTLTNTGSYSNWQTFTLPNVPVSGGTGSRALRLEALTNGFNINWINLNRVQVCGTNDIAVSQPSWGSSEASGYESSEAFDDDTISYWLSSSGSPQWMSVDLGSVQNIARVRLDWASLNWNNSGYGLAAYSTNYSIQLSDDGVNWTNATVLTNASGSLEDLAVSGSAQFVRMYSTGDVNGNGVGLFSFEVYPVYSTNSPTNTLITNGPVPIVNSSFSFQTVTPGSYLVGDPAYWSSSLESGTVDAVISPGGNGSGEPWPTNPVPGLNGTNFCQIYVSTAGGGGIVYQDTGVQYVPGCTYTLTTAFGLQTSQALASGSTMGLYNSDLVPVASTTITSNALISGAFKDVSINYTATGNEGGNGDIIVAFNVPASSSAGSYLDFNNVRLAVTIAPVSITNQPVSQTIVKGTNASFSVGALGSGVGYQWYYDTNTPVAGGTNSTLTLTNVQNGGTYDVVVTNSSGSVTSNIVNLIVQAGPSTLIDAQFGTSATQSGVAALGTSGDVWNAITGSTTNLVNSAGTPLVGAGLTLGSQGIFTDTGGSAMDVPTTALMEEYAYGITSPSKVSVGLSGLSQYEGDTFTLVVYAAGDKSGQGSSLKMTGGNGGNSGSTLNTTAISRQISLGNGIAYQTFTGTLTNGTLGITASIPSGGTYAIFNGFQLQLIPQAPAITTQPLSLSTNAGSSVTLSIAATGTTPGYRWYFDTNTPIIGATNSSLTLTNVRSSGTYDAVVSNSYGSSTSSIVKLTVLPNAPASLTSSTGTKSVTLTYSSVTNATFYVIYRSKVSGGPYTKLATTSATKYTDLNVVSGTTYYYVVVACDGLNLSSYSSQTSAEPH